VDHRVLLLNQLAAPKVKLPFKTEKQTANHHNTQKAGRADRILTPTQRKGVGQTNKPQRGNSSKQAQRKVTSKADQLVNYRDDLLNLRADFKLKQPHLTGRGTD
jgi:hypothetical protein